MAAAESKVSLLDEDVLIRISENLVDESDKKSWRRVSKDFLRVDSVTRKSLKIIRFEFILSLLTRFKNIEALDLSDCPLIDDGTVTMLLTRHDSVSCWTRGLKTLIMSRTSGLTYSGLDRLIRACPGLEVIDVSFSWTFGDREASALSNAKRLKELRLDKCLEITDVGLAKIVVGCGKLERLSLKWCLKISDLGIVLLCSKCLDLKALDLSYLKLTNESLRSIASLPRLELLAIVGCHFMDDVGLRFLEDGCPFLNMIDVSRSHCITSSGITSLLRSHKDLEHLVIGSHLPIELEVLKNLKTIQLEGTQLSESSIDSIISHSKSLIKIGLNKCIWVNNTSIERLICSCASLKILNLTCCQSITDYSICAIANSCQKLISLKLESCHNITKKSLQRLGSYCLLLEDLDLTDCSGVDDIGLEYLSGCVQLLSLKLGLCTNISDKGMINIARNCTNIQELDLYRCEGIGDDGLQALSSNCKKMKKLNLSYCINVTDRGLEFISLLEELFELDIRALKNITSVGLTSIASGCKRLSELDFKNCEKIDDSALWSLAYYSSNLRQINMSNCNITDVGLCLGMGNLPRLQDAKIVNLAKVTIEGFEIALRSCYLRIKKVKLSCSLRCSISFEILETLHARGCKVKWD